MRKVAQEGRKPGLMLDRPGGAVALQEWGLSIVDALQPLSKALDEALQADGQAALYAPALATQRAKLLDAALTPSAGQLQQVRQHGSFFDCVMSTSRAHHERLMADGLDRQREQILEDIVAQSVEQQAEMERSVTGSFDTFLDDYFSQLDTSLAQAGKQH